jgi:hypothetical protein
VHQNYMAKRNFFTEHSRPSLHRNLVTPHNLPS